MVREKKAHTSRTDRARPLHGGLDGTPFTPSLTKHFGTRLDALTASAVFLAIMGLTLLAIRGWVALTEQRSLMLAGCAPS